jgi:hypothetical protein
MAIQNRKLVINYLTFLEFQTRSHSSTTLSILMIFINLSPFCTILFLEMSL